MNQLTPFRLSLASLVSLTLIAGLLVYADRCDERWTLERVARREACAKACGGGFLEDAGGLVGCLCVSPSKEASDEAR